MNNIIVLLNAVVRKDIKISIDLNNGINYKCYVYDIDKDNIYTSVDYVDNPLPGINYKGYNVDIKNIVRVVIRATNVAK